MTAVPTAIPHPLVPAEVDLNGMSYMPLEISRLMNSDLFVLSTGDEFKAAVALWCKSWQQVPAASLPNNDRILAHLSGAFQKWNKLKAMAMQGWILCSDGRFYHPVVAEKALSAWEQRQDYEDRKQNEAERQRRHREDHKAIRAHLRKLGIVLPHNTPMSQLQETLSNALHNSDSNGPVTRTVTQTEHGLQRLIKGKGKGKVLNQEHVPQRDAPDDALTLEGPHGEQGEAQSHTTPEPVQPAPGASQASTRQAKPDALAGFDEFYAAYPRRQKRAEAEKAWRKLSPSPGLRQMLMAALAQHQLQDSWTKDGGQFVPLPASWLNARRWEDELEVATGQGVCPASEVVATYHQHCPKFDLVTVIDDTLRGLLEERWREHEAHQDLGFWSDFFTTASSMNQVFYRGQHRKPYLEALVARQNFRDIVEGRIHA